MKSWVLVCEERLRCYPGRPLKTPSAIESCRTVFNSVSSVQIKKDDLETLGKWWEGFIEKNEWHEHTVKTTVQHIECEITPHFPRGLADVVDMDIENENYLANSVVESEAMDDTIPTYIQSQSLSQVTGFHIEMPLSDGQYDNAVGYWKERSEEEVEESRSTVVVNNNNYPLTVYDLNLLKPQNWLNDEVINCYMSMLQERDTALCKSDPTRKPSYFFSSFFYESLCHSYEHVKKYVKCIFYYVFLKSYT